MAGLHLKNIPDHLHRMLSLRAQQNRRSLNREIIVMLEQALAADSAAASATVAEQLEEVARCRSRFGGELSLDEIDRLRREGRP